MDRQNKYLPGAGLILFFCCIALFIPWLGETLFYSKGEPREALVAVSILQNGDWILPRVFGEELPYKPPFMAWIIAFLAQIFNGGVVNEFIARLPSALAVTAMAMGGFFWARSFAGNRFAMVYGMVIITCFEVFRAGMACRLDMVLTALMTIATYMMFNLQKNRGRNRFVALKWLIVILLLSGAVLTKGPVGSLLPCFAVGIYCLLRRDNFFRALFSMLGVAVAAMILPAFWYYAAYLEGGQEFFNLMYEEVVGRLLGQMSYESHVNPVWYNFLTLATGLLPWTLLLIISLFGIGRCRPSQIQAPGLFSIVVAVVTIGFYCIPASKRSVYLLPAYPFIAYGIACALTDPRLIGFTKIYTWIMAFLAIVAPIGAGVANYIGIPKLVMDPLPWWSYALMIPSVLAGLLWFFTRRSPVGSVLACTWGLYLVYTAVMMPVILNPRSDYRAIETLKGACGNTVYTYDNGEKYQLYSLDFYLNDNIRWIHTLQEAAALPKGSYLLVPSVRDTTGLGEYYHFERLLDRSADHRHSIDYGIRK